MKASVCMASFNLDAEILENVLMSIFTQCPPFEYEVIVVDDGSSYGAPEVCPNFPVRYFRIEREPKTRCPCISRNLAYKMAKGDIIVAQADDVAHETPETIERLCTILEEHPNSFVNAYVVGIDKNGDQTEKYSGEYKGGHRPYFFLGALWKRDIYAIGGNDEEFTTSGGYCYDDRWFAKCLVEGRKLQAIYTTADQVMGVHQYHPSRFSTTEGKRYDKEPTRINELLYKKKVSHAEVTGQWYSNDGPWRIEKKMARRRLKQPLYIPATGSHLPLLMKAVSLTEGPILELGSGYHSTTSLHWACHVRKRKLVTYENDPVFFESLQHFATDWHEVHFIEDWDSIDLSGPWSVVLVDHVPHLRRGVELARVTHAEYVVCHDSEGRSDRRYGMSKSIPLYKYAFEYKGAFPHTSVYSNLHDVSRFIE